MKNKDAKKAEKQGKHFASTQTKPAAQTDLFKELPKESPFDLVSKKESLNNGHTLISQGAKEISASRKKAYWIPVVAVLSVFFLIYIGGVILFHLVFYPNTTFHDQDVSYNLIAELVQSQKLQTDNHVLNVSDQNGFSLAVKSADIDVRFNQSDLRQSVTDQQQPFLWPIKLFSPHILSFAKQISFNEKKLSEQVETAVADYNQNTTQPVNATAAFDAAKVQFVVQPEQSGTALDAKQVYKEILVAVKELKDTLVLSKKTLLRPPVKSDDKKLQSSIDQLNSYLSAVQTLTIKGSEAIKIDSAQIAAWCKIDEQTNPVMDSNLIVAWVKDSLAPKLDTVGGSRTYTDPSGASYTVAGGDYGWLVDSESLAEQLVASIQKGAPQSLEVPMKQTAQEYVQGGADWGSRWIDVNLSSQYAYLFDNGQILWESAIVSGKPSSNDFTPEGVYAIKEYMGRNITLVGADENGDGEPDYRSPVAYWMPFIRNSYGFHDAPWQSSFGGDRYQWAGSHGCVNLPTDKAASLYGLIQPGDPVVIHS